MLNNTKILLILLPTIFLSACSTTAVITPQSSKHHHLLSQAERQKRLYAIRDWDIIGSFSIKHNNKVDMASFTWQKNNNNYLINIHGPMNIGSTNLIGTQDKVILQQTSGKQLEATTAEKLLQHQLGLFLPVTNLNYWIRGLPSPNPTRQLHYDDKNRIHDMEQQNWQIIYNSYATFDNIDLPTKIYLNTQQLQIKIVIKQWRINTPTYANGKTNL